jgi:hypothetical protein
MSFHLHHALANARVEELRRAGAARRVAQPRHRPKPAGHGTESVTLRFGGAGDEAALARVAHLDSAMPPAQPVLLAEVGREVVAALSLADGSVVADPFRPSTNIVELLRARARQLDGETPARLRSPSRSWLRPVAPARR